MSKADVIAAYRSRLGWSQGTLATQAGISTSAIQYIESGRTPNPYGGTLSSIARAFICSRGFSEIELKAMLDALGVSVNAVRGDLERVLAEEAGRVVIAPPANERLYALLDSVIEIHGRARVQAMLSAMLVPNVQPNPVAQTPAASPVSRRSSPPSARRAAG